MHTRIKWVSCAVTRFAAMLLAFLCFAPSLFSVKAADEPVSGGETTPQAASYTIQLTGAVFAYEQTISVTSTAEQTETIALAQGVSADAIDYFLLVDAGGTSTSLAIDQPSTVGALTFTISKEGGLFQLLVQASSMPESDMRYTLEAKLLDVTAAITFPSSNTYQVSKSKFDLKNGQTETVTVTIPEGQTISKVVATQKDGPSIALALSGDVYQASIAGMKLWVKKEDWPLMTNSFPLTIEANGLTEKVELSVGITSNAQTHAVSITADEPAHVTLAGNTEDPIKNSAIHTLSVQPKSEYKISALKITYNTLNGNKSDTITASQSNWNGLKIEFSDTNVSSVSGQIFGDLSVVATVEKLPVYYTVETVLDPGLTRKTPAEAKSSVLAGGTLTVRFAAETGYIIGNMTVQYGKSYTTWSSGQSYLTMGSQRILVTEENNDVRFVLNDINYNVLIDVAATYDENNIPVTVTEGSRINIEVDNKGTVKRGGDAQFIISTTSNRYSVKNITLMIGEEKGTATPADEQITVGRKNYEIVSEGNGAYSIRVDNIREPVRLTATSDSGNVVSRPYVTINQSSNMKITKNTSSNTLYSGDDVTFYFTPSTNYQIDEITIKYGDVARTFGTDHTKVEVDGRTFSMRRASDGVVTLTMTNIDRNVTISGKAYYNKNGVSATGELRLNTNSVEPFLQGYAGYFRPRDNMTRAEAVVMLSRLSTGGVSAQSNNHFTDVASNAWYAYEVNAFWEANILDHDIRFYPDQNITREALVEFIYRMLGSPSYTGNLNRFNDISASASRVAICYAASSGWITGYGDGTFRPYQYISRAEVAAVLCRVLGRTQTGTARMYLDVSSQDWAYRYITMASAYQ